MYIACWDIHSHKYPVRVSLSQNGYQPCLATAKFGYNCRRKYNEFQYHYLTFGSPHRGDRRQIADPRSPAIAGQKKTTRLSSILHSFSKYHSFSQSSLVNVNLDTTSSCRIDLSTISGISSPFTCLYHIPWG